MIDYSEKTNGSGSISLMKWFIVGIFLAGWYLLSIYVGEGNIPFALAIACLPAIFLFIGLFIHKPVILFVILFSVNYIIMGLGRYISIPLPVSVLMDLLYLTTLATLLVNCLMGKMSTSQLGTGILFIYLIWVIYCLLQAFNETCGLGFDFVSWFREVRPYAFHTIYIILIFSLLIRKTNHIKWFLYLWAFFTLLAAAKGYWQRNRGFDTQEMIWLLTAGARTHFLVTGIRYFSFFSDAANFGSNMAFCVTTFGIATLMTRRWWEKIYFGITTIGAGYGMLISGTRSAVFVAIIGVAMSVVLSKNFKLFCVSSVVLIAFVGMLKFTLIGDNNPMIHRMRTAFDPEDASLAVRTANKKAMRSYMNEIPWGIGLGRGEGNVPNNNKYYLVATTPPDSTLVYIWVRTGIIGIILYMFLFVATMAGGAYIILFKIKDKELRSLLTAMLCGAASMMVAGYGNEVYTQYPNPLLIFGCETIVYLGPYIDKRIAQEKKEKEELAHE